ncbi:hypothetical protein [Actinophytocola glycyrrhizae]|uniref:Uncharacterized protein n=1 Tax=Actinophytocola glycyrrhizae TaxID=2044873 RepID=A0ABV9SAR1_9PSEU
MADMHEIDTALSTAMPEVFSEIDSATKENFGRLVDYYAGSGYSTGDVVTVVDQQLGSTDIGAAKAEELTAAVDSLCETLPGDETVTEEDVPVQAPSTEEIFQVLGDAAGEDLAEALTTAMPEFEANLVRAVWAEVRPAIQAEIDASPETWSDPEAVREASYHALRDAIEGFLAEGDAEGFEIVLTTAS